ncbi:MAG: hypothetical protein Q4C77_09875 [Eubacteriales bacterium]|nr:hypothetical protein [Eubacteriales bacterium]
MPLLTEKLLIISIRLENSNRKCIRYLGKLLGILPVRYSRRMEKRLFDGTWDPVKRYRKRCRKVHRGKKR